MSRSALTTLGRYRLQDLIAAGGMGEVWRAVDTVLERSVAIKMLYAEGARQAETVARFRREARLAGSVSHPAIASVYDFGEAGPAHPPYLVMELVDGPSLADVLSSGPLDAVRTLDVIAQAAAGLHAAHRAGLVHQDVKPANLLLDRDGHVKVTDFGIAHASGSAPATVTGMIACTPAYLAPERAAGGPATPASDVYSLGVMAYECLAGHPPFTGAPIAVVCANRDLPLPPLPGTVPAGAAALVAELTAKDPAGRPSAGEAAAQAARLRDALPDGVTTETAMAAATVMVAAEADVRRRTRRARASCRRGG
jgi:serine/threonine-protein kinase